MEITAEVYRDPETSSSDTAIDRELEEQLSDSTDGHIEGNHAAQVNVSPHGSGILASDSDPQRVHQETQRSEVEEEGSDTAMVNVSPQGSGSLTSVIGPHLAQQTKHLNQEEIYSESEILRLNSEENHTVTENENEIQLLETSEETIQVDTDSR